MRAQPGATLKDLSRVEGKAELIRGKIVRFMAAGRLPAHIAGRVARSLSDHADRLGRGEVFGSTLVYAVPEVPSGRESFSPDVSYYDGPLPANPMSFIEGPPTFAVEVRSENDYGPTADSEYAAKRDDYFQAGTKAVWDVDPVARTIRCYRAAAPAHPQIFRSGDSADAEPAVPGWRVNVDWIFG